ncbi:hypothetical protein LEP1GSC124_0400, partial [Leptospira interrogans serovar Pyrogenes str. 200701872]
MKVLQEDSKNIVLKILNTSSHFDQVLEVKTIDPSPIFRLEILKNGILENYR